MEKQLMLVEGNMKTQQDGNLSNIEKKNKKKLKVTTVSTLIRQVHLYIHL